MNNKEIAQKIFDDINNIGFKITDISWGNRYFIFNMGEDSIVWFKIKKLKGWKFSIWINQDAEKNNVQFFTQHIDNIDKFKPSRSYFLAEYNMKSFTDPNKYEFYKIRNIIKSIRKHPFISYIYDALGYQSYFEKSFICEVLNYKISNIFETFKEKLLDSLIIWTKLKVMLCKHNKIINNIKITDLNSDDWKCNPRYNVTICFNNTSSDEKELIFLRKWFNRYYNEKNLKTNMQIGLLRDGVKERYSYH